MKNRVLLLAAALLTFACLNSRGEEPRVFLLNGHNLAEAKRRIAEGDASLKGALEDLERDARDDLKAEPFTVVSKKALPPSGDKHDYMSQAPYFWPDPKSSNGLPYIRKDGERNPEIRKYPDHHTMDELESAVETLGLAYYFTGKEEYAEKSAQLLRAWFLEPATRMNCNLEYAQAIPGINTGRGIGIIESRGLTRVVDAVGLLAGSKAWAKKDQQGMEEWFEKFLKWMQESEHGKAESAAKNNHGTYYDVQVCSFALFLGKRDLAGEVLKTAEKKRIALQIQPDGKQPLELARTKGWGYSVGNLSGLMSLARLGENVGVDLWKYRTEDGRSIQNALDYLIPFGMNERKWPYQQIGGWPPQMVYPLIRRAAKVYDDAKYKELAEKLPKQDEDSRGRLLNPETVKGKDAKS